jgi:hypothetical protein
MSVDSFCMAYAYTSNQNLKLIWYYDILSWEHEDSFFKKKRSETMSEPQPKSEKCKYWWRRLWLLLQLWGKMWRNMYSINNCSPEEVSLTTSLRVFHLYNTKTQSCSWLHCKCQRFDNYTRSQCGKLASTRIQYLLFICKKDFSQLCS